MQRVVFLLNMLSPDRVPFFLGLARSGFNVSIRASRMLEPNRSYDTSILNELDEGGVDLAELPGWVIDVRRFPLRTDFFQVPFGLGNVLDNLIPDVVVSNQLGLRTYIASRWARRRGVPSVPWIAASPHAESRNSPFRELFRRRLVNDCPYVFATGTECVRYVAGSLSVPNAKIVQIPYAVSAAWWEDAIRSSQEDAAAIRKRLELKRFVLLYVGQLIRRKGIAELFDALRLLTGSLSAQLDLLAVGGEPSANLRQLADQVPVRVIWQPFVQPKELPAFFACADALILPCLEDEWGLVLNEGAAAGLPLLASKYAGGTSDFVRNNRNGFVLDPSSPQQMANAISKFFSLSQMDRNRMAVESKIIAEDWDLAPTVMVAGNALKKIIERV